MSKPDPAERLLRKLGPSMQSAGLPETLRAAAGALVGIGLAAAVALVLARGDLGLFMIAPFGASAVLLFAVPNSPLAQPWSAVVGNTVSALVGVAVVMSFQNPVLSVALAGGGAIMAMHLCRALHPPGGAVALTAVLAPEAVNRLGWGFALSPVLAGTAFLVAAAIAWAHLTGRRYPFRQPSEVNRHGTTDRPAMDRLGITPLELARLLQDYRQSANIGVEDLARLIGAAEMLSAQHQTEGVSAADIMSRDLVTVMPDTPLSEVAEIFRARGFTSLPVVGADMEYFGVIFQIHLIRRAQEDAARQGRGFAAAMRQMLDRGRTAPPVASDVMSVTVPHAAQDTPVSALFPFLAGHECDAVPVLEKGRIVGIVTQTDLIAALAHRQG